ncbi:stage IV sporulation protein A [Jutongia hominis]|jgi:stage IV sporulation protein A|uniref:Stage IV sporulation protein A n=1 Tax=Jutongia hominis TaxID=2763664 RepID=A0ABR7MUC7_9FIRM|nr:stage IV sporulation protein A [Jutongia hominis]MBC8557412.1 stage IV sporulation protein A [Jutongia hominis]
MSGFKVYQDLAERTNGEFYLGVCGPVRTGKSTFIKRFMELMVIPGIEDENEKERTTDELPQSADGKTIMTTEPKFIPKEAVSVDLYGENQVKVRMIDCVGYIVQEAEGIREEENERMVMTPWSKEPMPFSEAAEFGTRKVIHDHSTLGIVVTTDGSFGEISREAYVPAEERTIQELKSIGKPFVVLLNTVKPFGEEAKELARKLSEKYEVSVLPVNCNQLRNEDIGRIMEQMLSVFPIRQLVFRLPKWVEMLPIDHWLKKELIESVRKILDKISLVRDVIRDNFAVDNDMIREFKIDSIGMENGIVQIEALFDDSRYYQIISELVGTPIEGEYQLIHLLKEYVGKKEEIEKLSDAWKEVHAKGYGVITPGTEEIVISEPEIIRHGNKFGVKIKAVSPSVHLIQANIETEIAPIVGTQQQAEDLIHYIAGQNAEAEESIWDTNIFGKTVRQLVEEGMTSKVNRLTEESQMKLQDTLQKVINDSNGGLVCIII